MDNIFVLRKKMENYYKRNYLREREFGFPESSLKLEEVIFDSSEHISKKYKYIYF